MGKPIVGKCVLIELREYFVEFLSLGKIEEAFKAAGIQVDSEATLGYASTRRQMVEQYYSALHLDSLDDARKILRVIERQIQYCKIHFADVSPPPLQKVLSVLEEAGFQVKNDKITKTQTPLSFQQIHVYGINSASINADWERMIQSVEEDPEDAITAARALVESTCKTILEELGIPYENNWDLPRLYKQTADTLQLSPSGYQEQTFKQILGACSSITQGLAEVRNLLGDAHGKGNKGYRASPRHARLALNAAGTLAIFLLETLEARNLIDG